ncbi:hydrogenase iron-sulfur subunit [bacterium]|nr:hydrogenase iron-sulfur subunit [bacterium]
MSKPFKPKILTFLCNWCSYAGADLAGVSRIQYPPTIRVVRTMCSGRIDPHFIVDGLQSGFDGVFIGGCHIGECHYQDGNVYTLKRMNMLEQVLEESGIGKDRVHLRWASAAEAQPFADYVNEVTDIIKNLGPFNKEQYKLELSALSRTLKTPRVRWLTGIDRKLTERENVYHEKTNPEYLQQVLSKAVKNEYQKSLLIEILKQAPLTVPEMAEQTGMPLYTVSQCLNDLEINGLAEFKEYDGRNPRFMSLVT